MKIVLQKEDSAFVWETPPIVDVAQSAIEQYWKAKRTDQTNMETRRLIEEIEQKITTCLWIITAGCALGGKEGATIFDRLDESLNQIVTLTHTLGEEKFGSPPPS